MSLYFALQAVVFMIGFVYVYDRLHRRNRHYRRLRAIYDAIMGNHRATGA
ncbi:MAG TPA: hypothetical protein VJ732_13865 [Bryobacteraceae bacterium]|nr:hypothetical protein [Bryobacteraceae bacterium]